MSSTFEMDGVGAEKRNTHRSGVTIKVCGGRNSAVPILATINNQLSKKKIK